MRSYALLIFAISWYHQQYERWLPVSLSVLILWINSLSVRRRDKAISPVCLAAIVGCCADSEYANYNALQCRVALHYFVLSVCCGVCFLASMCYQEYSYIHMGELTVWIAFSTVAIRMYRSSPLAPLDSYLTAAAYLSMLTQVNPLCHKPVIWRSLLGM